MHHIIMHHVHAKLRCTRTIDALLLALSCVTRGLNKLLEKTYYPLRHLLRIILSRLKNADV